MLCRAQKAGNLSRDLSDTKQLDCYVQLCSWFYLSIMCSVCNKCISKPSRLLKLVGFQAYKTRFTIFPQDLVVIFVSAMTFVSFASGFTIRCWLWKSVFLHSFYTFIRKYGSHYILNLKYSLISRFLWWSNFFEIQYWSKKFHLCCFQTLVVSLIQNTHFSPYLSVAFYVMYS